MSAPGKRTVSKSEYRKYIQSSAWRKKRKDYFNSKLPKDCWVCGSRDKLDLHHRTYKNLGNERLMDLVPLCRLCHEGVHQFVEDTGKNLWEGTTKYRKLYRKGRVDGMGRVKYR